MSTLDVESYLNKSRESSENTRLSFGVSPLPRAKAKADFTGTTAALFRQNNTIVSALNNTLHRHDRFTEEDPNFDPLENLPPGHARYAYKYLDAKNLDDIRDRFWQVEDEIADREKFSDKPIQSFFTNFIAANADPSILFPGTLFYRNYKAQLSAAKQAAGVGGAMGLQTAGQEFSLHQTQMIRTGEESATNIVAATAIGSAVGAYAAHFLNSPSGRRATKQTSQIFDDGDITPPGVAPLPDGVPPVKPSGGEGKSIALLPDDIDYPIKENALEYRGEFVGKELQAPHAEGERGITYAEEGLFHGTPRELGNLQHYDERTSENQQLGEGSIAQAVTSGPTLTQTNTPIYGHGFYTTNDPAIAKRYTKKEARKAAIEGAKNPTVYKIEERYPIKLKDIDVSIHADADFLHIVNELRKIEDAEAWIKNAVKTAATKTFSKFIDELRNAGIRNQITAAQFQEFMKTNIMYPLAQVGYRGFTHVGGRLTGGKKHNVNIYWYPRDDLEVFKFESGGGGGNVPPAVTSEGFAAPEGKSVSAANVMESALTGQALRMGEKTAKAFGLTLGKLTPGARLATNRLGYFRLAGESIFENNWRYKKNYSIREQGQEKGWKPNQIALETRIKTDMGKVTSLLMKLDNVYFKQRGIELGEVLKTEKDFFAKQGLSRDEFEDAAFFDVINGFVDQREGVGEAARLIHEFFEEWKEKYTELGVFPKGMTVRNSINYFTHYYNVPWIQDPRHRPQAEQILTDYYKMVNNLVEENLPEIKKYLKELKKAKKEFKKLKKEGADVEELQKQIDDFKKAFRERMPEDIFDSEWKPRSFVLDDDQIWVSVQNTLDNIMNLNNEKFSNQYLSRMGIGGNPRPTNNRTLLIPTEQIAPMLIRSWRKVLPMFAHAMIPNYHITRFAQSMGFADTTEDTNVGVAGGQVLGGFLALARDELDQMIRGLDEKETAKYYKAFRDGQKDIKAGLELLLGIFGNGYNTNDNSFAKFSKVLAAINYTRMMGYMVVSSITDPAYIVLRNGYAAMVHEGILPIIENLKSAKYNREFLQSLGKSIETYTGYRLKSYADQNELVGSPGKVSKAFDYILQRYGNTTGMSQWTDLMQWVTGNIHLNLMLKNIVGYAKNIKELEALQKQRDALLSQEKVDIDAVREIERQLGQAQPLPDDIRSKYLAMGLTDKHFKVLYEQWSKIGGVEDDVFWIDWGAWDMSTKQNIDVLGDLQAALIKEVDSTIILPGLGDKPLFQHSQLGHLMLQFKSFGFGSTSRIFTSGLTHADANTYNGIVLTLFLGALGYIVTSLLKNKEIDTSIKNLAFEAVDRSGLLGVMMEVPLTLQKMGLLPGAGTSRYQSRDWVGALGGPSLGTISDVVSILNRIKNVNEEPLQVKDFNKAFRLFPWNNVWYFDGLNRNLGITDEFARGLGFEENT